MFNPDTPDKHSIMIPFVNWKKLFVDDAKIDWNDARVLMRVDFNVPMEQGIIQDNQRIAAVLPTIIFLKDKSVKSIVLMSHLGRPDGRPNASLSLEPISHELGRLLGQTVVFIKDVYSDIVPGDGKLAEIYT